MNRYKWLLFDADGTLFDYDHAESAALENSFDHFGWQYKQDYGRIYRTINGQIWREFELGLISQKNLRSRRFEMLFDSIAFEADAESFSRVYLQNLSLGTELIDDAEEITNRLHQEYQLAIITNGLKDVQRPRLAKSTIGRLFKALVISEEVGAAKPDPKIFDAAFNLIGNPSRAEVLIIGDSLASDIEGGFRYGIDTCWFNPNGHASDPMLEIRYEISELRQLLSILLP